MPVGRQVQTNKQTFVTKIKGNDHFQFSFSFPILSDYNENAGLVGGHYFYQDLFVAQKIFDKTPEVHVDVGSRIDGFVTHVASFREIKVFDIRPMEKKLKNISFIQKDIMNDSPELNDICDSISCLHALEHFGLGRYGDPIDYFGHIKGLKSLNRMLKRGGILYLSVPIGTQRIEFNAQRVFSVSYILEITKPYFELIDFSYVDDKGEFLTDITFNRTNTENNFFCEFGCGIFEFKKIK